MGIVRHLVWSTFISLSPSLHGDSNFKREIAKRKQILQNRSRLYFLESKQALVSFVLLYASCSALFNVLVSSCD